MWVYKGKEYNVPPKAMIVDVILREVYGNTEKSLIMKLIKIVSITKELEKIFDSI